MKLVRFYSSALRAYAGHHQKVSVTNFLSNLQSGLYLIYTTVCTKKLRILYNSIWPCEWNWIFFQNIYHYFPSKLTTIYMIGLNLHHLLGLLLPPLLTQLFNNSDVCSGVVQFRFEMLRNKFQTRLVWLQARKGDCCFSCQIAQKASGNHLSTLLL